MYKKLLIFSGVILFLIIMVVFYQLSSPKQLPQVSSGSGAEDETGLRAEEFLTHITTQSGVQYYWLDNNDNNSEYLETYVIQPLFAELSSVDSNVLQAVEMSSSNAVNSELKETLAITELPAVIAIEYVNQEIVVRSSIEWNTDSPISLNDLRNWFHEQGLLSSLSK